jgi:hypothetical protein
MENQLLQSALEYWDKGISIFPLIPNDKKPLSEALPMYDNGIEIKPSWIPFQTERMTRERVIELWTKYPKANIAGIMGKISGVICMDQDILKDKETGTPILDEFGDPVERGDISGFSPTLSATTWSGGKHSIYRYVEGVPTKHGFRKMIDIQSDKSYIVLSPSIVNGKSYEWDMDWKEMWSTLDFFPVEVLPKEEVITGARLDIKQFINVDHGSRNDKMHKLVCSLYAKGYTDEEVVFLANEINRTYKPPIGEQKGDKPDELETILCSARDFITSTKTNDNKNILKAFNFLSWREFNSLEFPENPWRIEKLIPEFGITIIGAPSGGKKSWVGLDMARSIVSGLAFLGMYNTKKGNVLYIEQETPQEEVQRRGRQLRLNELDGVWIASSKDAPLNLNNDNTIKQLTEFVNLNNISTVFIDTLRSVAGGLKEEKAEEIRMFFNRFKSLAEHGVAVIILDHTRKPRQFENRTKPMIDQILGSQDKIASATNVLMLGTSKENNSLTLFQMKLKSGKEEKPFTIIMRDEDEGGINQKTYLEYGGSFDEEQLKVEKAKDTIKVYLEEEGIKKTAKEIIEALSKEIGKSNVEIALKSMREHEEIGYKKDGNAYYYWFPWKNNEDGVSGQDSLDLS